LAKEKRRGKGNGVICLISSGGDCLSELGGPLALETRGEEKIGKHLAERRGGRVKEEGGMREWKGE